VVREDTNDCGGSTTELHEHLHDTGATHLSLWNTGQFALWNTGQFSLLFRILVSFVCSLEYWSVLFALWNTGQFALWNTG